ncbi:pentapeptide repeat-containing protein [Curtobacterium ammoniigenes]|uniref:pentapeptide repeat-containing protein n=1 Tax=Curtobacterium ammoniigenes TaxID=395387 RepID=UPI00082C4DE6|nr:pentapeptide repeat-containing protein [Curtobacterium ammoniigenes]
MASDTDAPRLNRIEPGGLDPIDDEELGELLSGDLLEGRSGANVDLDGRVLRDLAIEECTFAGIRLDGTELQGARFREVLIDRLDASVLRAARTTWHGVRVEGGRVGSAELYDTRFDDVVVSEARLGFLNLRASRLRDVLFRGCRIDELDVDGAVFERVAFDGCTIGAIAGTAARVAHVDLRGADLDRIDRLEGLRGATLSDEQVWSLAPLLAREAGFRVG